MRVELRNHPAQAHREGRLPDGTMENVPLFDEAGKPVPLFPDQHGVYYQPADNCVFTCVGYCMQTQGKPVCLIEHFAPAEAEFIRAEVDRLRGGGTSRLAMISAPEVEAEPEPETDDDGPQLILPSGFVGTNAEGDE